MNYPLRIALAIFYISYIDSAMQYFYYCYSLIFCDFTFDFIFYLTFVWEVFLKKNYIGDKVYFLFLFISNTIYFLNFLMFSSWPNIQLLLRLSPGHLKRRCILCFQGIKLNIQLFLSIVGDWFQDTHPPPPLPREFQILYKMAQYSQSSVSVGSASVHRGLIVFVWFVCLGLRGELKLLYFIIFLFIFSLVLLVSLPILVLCYLVDKIQVRSSL